MHTKKSRNWAYTTLHFVESIFLYSIKWPTKWQFLIFIASVWKVSVIFFVLIFIWHSWLWGHIDRNIYWTGRAGDLHVWPSDFQLRWVLKTNSSLLTRLLFCLVNKNNLSSLVGMKLLLNCMGRGFESHPSNMPVMFFTGLGESTEYSRVITHIDVWVKKKKNEYSVSRCKFNIYYIKKTCQTSFMVCCSWVV